MEESVSVEELVDRVSDLEARVSYLESEVGVLYEEERFRRRVNSLFPEDVDVTVTDNRIGGYHTRVSGISVDALNAAIERIQFNDQCDYEWAMTETADGVGMEIWTN